MSPQALGNTLYALGRLGASVHNYSYLWWEDKYDEVGMNRSVTVYVDIDVDINIDFNAHVGISQWYWFEENRLHMIRLR